MHMKISIKNLEWQHSGLGNLFGLFINVETSPVISKRD